MAYPIHGKVARAAKNSVNIAGTNGWDITVNLDLDEVRELRTRRRRSRSPWRWTTSGCTRGSRSGDTRGGVRCLTGG